MQNKILLLIVIILSVIYFSIGSSNTTFFNSSPREIIVKNTKTNNISSLKLEEYIIGVVASEMPASFCEEALKAQAVASRTYAMFKIQNSSDDFDVVTDVSNQGYITLEEMKIKWKDEFNKYYNKIKNAVLSTKGEVMYYNEEIIEAYYFAMSNGYTEKASLVFNEDRDYLQSVPSSYDLTLSNFEVTKEISKEDICNKLEINCSNVIFSNIIRSDTGRVNYITINGIVFKGTEVRNKLGLRSTDFYIKEDGSSIYITTKGYGHGVGMSQYGANGLAKEGYTYDEILKYYYKNVKISSI